MKVKAIRGFAIVLVALVVGALGFMGYKMVDMMVAEAMGNQTRAEVVGEAPLDAFEGFEAFVTGDPAFDVGVNVYGDVIFVDRKAAVNAAKQKCAEAISEMRSQVPELRRFGESSVYIYADYVWQINWDDVDERVNQQHLFLSRILLYYENGDPHDGEV